MPGTMPGTEVGTWQTPPATGDRHVPDSTVETTALAVLRAQGMAAYAEQLLAPYVRRIEEQAELIGRLKERAEDVERLREEVRQAQDQREEIGRLRADWEQAQQRADEAAASLARRKEEAAAAPATRPWWRFW